MKKSAALFVVLAAAGTVFAGDISHVNGFDVDLRTPINHIPGSSLQWGPVGSATNNAPVPANADLLGNSIEFNEQFPAGTTNTGFANKHVGWFSDNGGASRFAANLAQSFTINFDVKIDCPVPGGPRKEGGLAVRNYRPTLPWLEGNGFFDDGEILVASDGEVAVFGAAMPFTGMGNVYTAGTTAHISFEYFAPGVADPTLGAYQLIFTDAVTGVHDSGLKIWGAESDGVYGFNYGSQFGFLAQNQYIPVINDYSDISYNNLHIVPAPGALALVGLGGLFAGRRRR